MLTKYIQTCLEFIIRNFSLGSAVFTPICRSASIFTVQGFVADLVGVWLHLIGVPFLPLRSLWLLYNNMSLLSESARRMLPELATPLPSRSGCRRFGTLPHFLCLFLVFNVLKSLDL